MYIQVHADLIWILLQNHVNTFFLLQKFTAAQQQ